LRSNDILSAELRQFCRVVLRCVGVLTILPSLLFVSRLSAQANKLELRNSALRVTVNPDGTYSIAPIAEHTAILRAGVAVQVGHRWIKLSEYPKREVTSEDFADTLGRGRQATVKSSGLPNEPDLIYTIRVYADRPFGEVQVQVTNQSAQAFQVESIRSLEALGSDLLNLFGSPASARVLSDSFSEDWPPLQIYDLGKAPNGLHRGVGSQLIYNQESKQGLFLGALTSDRLLTILDLKTQLGSAAPGVASFTVDSTGTTEIQATDEESGLHDGPRENLVELNLPLPSGASLSGERLMFAAGPDYLSQLENYGSAIKELHHSRIPEENMLGWWSWTAYYTKITEGNTFTNALWLAEHLKQLGYDYFHFDLGYGYSRGDYAVTNASQFPHGMWSLTHRIGGLGLRVGVWTAPLEVGARSSIYQQHPDWLVRNLQGKLIQITTAEEMPGEGVFVLDTTNPGAQEFLRQTYQTLVREWGVRYIKLDFMDSTAIEGKYYRPNTTALEAQRIGLQVIRSAVGNDVLLDKDGSPMLNPVGLVDDGRISQDTGHTFDRSKEAAPGIAARYYMHRNFFINDPDAFTVSRQLVEERKIQAPLTLNEAQVSIGLAAVSGGMYEIGDDLPTLGKDADRVGLLENPDLLQMAKLGRVAIPLDLLSYSAADEQPSIFFLREDKRQSILAVFNWTEHSTSHHLPFSELSLSPSHNYEFKDVFEPSARVSVNADSIELEQPAHSVKLLKIVDNAAPAAAPSVTASVPAHAKINEDLAFSATIDPQGVPAVAYHWDFGDGTRENGKQVRHAYTMAGDFTVHLAVEGVDGLSAEKTVSVSVNGALVLPPPSRLQSSE
jgi:alpha-galactosidase